MKQGDKKVVMASIDAIIELLTEVVKEARETGAEDIWMLNYILAEMPYVFRKEGEDVLLQSVQADVRLP